MSKEKLVIVDGNSFIFRAFYATFYTGNIMKTSEGIATNALFGYINFIESIIQRENPNYLFIALDKGSNTFRKKIYEDYKSHRDAAPSELIHQFKLIREYMDVRNIKWLESNDFEADDIVGSFAKKYENDTEISIYTGDRDYLQLASDNVAIKMIKKGGMANLVTYYPNDVIEEYGVNPQAFIDLKAIVGDKSDNIPGISGIGEKGALKYLQKYETLENIYEQIESEKASKTKEKFLNDKDNAFLSQKLATIRLDMDFDFDLNTCVFNLNQGQDFIDFLTKYELQSIKKRFEVEAVKPQLDVQEITWSNEFKSAPNTIIDVITSKQDSYHDREFLIICAQNEHGYFKFNQEMINKELLKQLFTPDAIVFDSKKINVMLSKLDFDLINFENDLMLGSYCIDSSKAFVSLTKYSFLHGIEINDKKFILKNYLEEEKNVEINQTLIKRLQLLSLILEKNEILSKDQDLKKLYEMEMQTSRVLTKMELNGIWFDKQSNQELTKLVDDKLEVLNEQIIDLAGEEFNVKSPKQLSVILFDKLELPTKKKRSTSADILESLRFMHPIIDKILEYRLYSKLSSTYLHGLVKHVREDKIHTVYNQVGTTTGRLSSNYPNLQNIPSRLELGRQIRKSFIAKPGYKLLAIDYSQIELRVIASMSNETHMIEAFNEDYDIHKDTAAKVLGCDYNQVTSEQRKMAKAINFGIIYGMGPYKLSQDLNISRKQAQDFIKSYENTYPNIKNYIDSTIEFAKKHEYVETLFKRKRFISGINDKNKMIASLNERIAVNSPIQGSAADILKLAMIKIDEKITTSNINAKLLLQIHDELVFEVKEDQIEEVTNVIKEIMENTIDLSVKLNTNSKSGSNWFDMK